MNSLTRNVKPSHPGTVFRIEVLEPLGISITEAANRLHVTRKALSEVLNAKASLSPAMAKRWARFTNTSVASWYNMQANLDIWGIENSHVANEVNPFTNFKLKEVKKDELNIFRRANNFILSLD